MIYEIYGQLAESAAIERAEHLRTIDILRSIAAGDITPDQLTVEGNSWQVSEQTKETLHEEQQRVAPELVHDP